MGNYVLEFVLPSLVDLLTGDRVVSSWPDKLTLEHRDGRMVTYTWEEFLACRVYRTVPPHKPLRPGCVWVLEARSTGYAWGQYLAEDAPALRPVLVLDHSPGWTLIDTSTEDSQPTEPVDRIHWRELR